MNYIRDLSRISEIRFIRLKDFFINIHYRLKTKKVYCEENYSKKKTRLNKRISNEIKEIFKDYLKIIYYIIKRCIEDNK